ncbi:zinc finger BED domain-containing protein 5 [Trichonephila clavipes]|nr:zinc finger BED domain-containing protein 5 [Trichonephila clavipes]
MLNSRPLVPLSSDLDDLNVLTPSHFLIGRSITSIVEPDLTDLNENRLDNWQKITKIIQLIWKRWSVDYLNSLQQRNKWHFEKKNAKIGDMVIIKEDNLPSCQWSLGRINNIYPGKDSKVRVVEVKTTRASYEWVRDPFQNTPEGLSTTEEEIFIDFTSSGEIKRQFCNKTLFQFWAEVDDEFSELKTKAFRILLPFSRSYLCETGFSAVAALKTKYRSQLNIEKELRVSISNIKPPFENLCSARQAHGSH